MAQEILSVPACLNIHTGNWKREIHIHTMGLGTVKSLERTTVKNVVLVSALNKKLSSIQSIDLLCLGRSYLSCLAKRRY